MKNSPEIKHINQSGDFVEADSPESAYVVNMSDVGAQDFITSIKVKAGLATPLASSPLRLSPPVGEAPKGETPLRETTKAGNSKPAK